MLQCVRNGKPFTMHYMLSSVLRNFHLILVASL